MQAVPLDPVEQFVGRSLNDLPTYVVRGARVLTRDTVATADYRPSRLNLIIDKHDVVQDAYYG